MGSKPMKDGRCLCGRPHPCPAHGRWNKVYWVQGELFDDADIRSRGCR